MDTRERIEGYIQQFKDDWWLCQCGKEHKGFPYDCPFNTDEKRKKAFMERMNKK